MTRRKKDGTWATPVPAADFPIASDAVQATINSLVTAFNAIDISADIRGGLEVVAVHGTTAGPAPEGDVVVSLFYNRMLGPNWTSEAEALRLSHGFKGIVGRARSERAVVGDDFVVERLEMAGGRVLRYVQVEGHFSNPNTHIATATLDWLADCSKAIIMEYDKADADVDRATPPSRVPNSDLLEMFCRLFCLMFETRFPHLKEFVSAPSMLLILVFYDICNIFFDDSLNGTLLIIHTHLKPSLIQKVC